MLDFNFFNIAFISVLIRGWRNRRKKTRAGSSSNWSYLLFL